MKYNVKSTTAVSNVNGESLEFKIGNPAVLIDILRNKLYSDKIRVVVQEYLCNARDAMREAGNTKDRIEITLPTTRKPTLSIRDFGPGLSPQRVGEVFVQFGNSTKRDTEKQTGGFGIGGKSAFAYTDSFTVISISEGIETHYVAHLGKNSVGTLDKVYEGKAKGKSGVEIQIGVNLSGEENDEGESDLNWFNQMVFRTIAFWSKEEMPVITNEHDAETSGYFELYERVTQGKGFRCDKAIIFSDSDRNSYGGNCDDIQLVIDGILYDLDLEQSSKQLEALNGALNATTAYLIIPAGVLEIAASRESIAYNQANKNALNTIFNDALKDIKAKAAKMIGEVQTLGDAKKTMSNLKVIHGSARNVTRKVEGISIDFGTGHLSEKEGYRGLNLYGRRRTSASWNAPKLNAYFLHNDADLAESTLQMKAKEIMKSNQEISDFTVVPKDLVQQAQILGATAVSTLRAKRQYSEKQALPEGTVNIRVFQGRGDRTEFSQVDLDDTRGVTYVLVENVETREVMLKYLALQMVFDKSSGDVKIAFPSKATLKAVAGKDGFISEKDFFKDVRKHIGADSFERAVKLIKTLYVGDAKDYFKDLDGFDKHAKNINDSAFSKYFSSIKGLTPRKQKEEFDSEYVAHLIKDELVKSVFDQHLGAVAELPAFVEYVKETYPLVSEGYYYGGKEVAELVHYINGKYAHMAEKQQAKAG